MANEAKFTAGPWLVEGSTVYALHGNPPRNRFSALVQAGRRDDASEEERRANAILMAAAPTLLNAARRVDSAFAAYPFYSDALIELRAAIAAALGSPQ